MALPFPLVPFELELAEDLRRRRRPELPQLKRTDAAGDFGQEQPGGSSQPVWHDVHDQRH